MWTEKQKEAIDKRNSNILVSASAGSGKTAVLVERVINRVIDDKYEEVKEALNVGEYNMIVTPKEIDDLIENMKDIVARGINFAI